MVWVYLAASSLLLFFASGAAAYYREENAGIVWFVISMMTILVIFLRVANLISKLVYKACSGEKKKVTISDLMLFDGGIFLLYGIIGGLGKDIADAEGWMYLAVIGIPVFAVAVYSVVRRFRQAKEIYRKRHEKVFLNE